MKDEFSPQTIVFWLQEAKELMVSAERCWKADEVFRQQIAGGRGLLIDNGLMQMRIDAEVELNWLYNILAGLSIYCLAIGILIARDPMRFSSEPPNQRIAALVGECGIELAPKQRAFLERVENALSFADKGAKWKISLNPQQLKFMKQKFAAADRVTQDDKRAMDALFAELIASVMKEIAAGLA